MKPTRKTWVLCFQLEQEVNHIWGRVSPRHPSLPRARRQTYPPLFACLPSTKANQSRCASDSHA